MACWWSFNSPVIQRSIERMPHMPFAQPGAFVLVQSELPEFREILFIAQDHHRSIVEAIEANEPGRRDAGASTPGSPAATFRSSSKSTASATRADRR